MFESDGKKEMNSKYNKLKGLSSKNASPLKHKFNGPIGENLGGSQSVYAELKLSTKLSDQLTLTRNEVHDLNVKLEQFKYENDKLRG